jgi:hypothetical protein
MPPSQPPSTPVSLLSTPSETTSPETLYATRRDRFDALAAIEELRSRWISWGRLGAVLLALAAGLTTVLTAAANPKPWLILTAVAILTFMVLALVHDRRLDRLHRWQGLATLNRMGLARIARRWDDLPIVVGGPPAPSAAMSKDLGICGPVSLLRLLGSSLSPPGRSTLIDWLFEPAAPDDLATRQVAVAELSQRIDERQELELEGGVLRALDPDISPFLEWCEGEAWLLNRPLWMAASWILPMLTVGSTALALLGLLPYWPSGVLVLLQFILGNLQAGRLAAALDAVSHREREMQSYGRAFSVLESWSPTSPRLVTLLGRLVGDSGRPSEHLHRLHGHLESADVRHSGTLHFVLVSLLLWDFHCLRRLEIWRREVGGRVRDWLAVLGEVEALAALSILRSDHPSWAVPLVADSNAGELRAEGLGHPLLSDAQRVTNTIALGPPGRFLLVTGSNMSGKSTLLRAIGLDVVLAQAGAPVCAQSMSLSPVRLATSIVVEDSLGDGVSLFLAELLRLREVVTAAEEQSGSSRPLLFLLDEILRGTNSHDRHVAVRRVLRRLLDSGAIGAISTHDVALANAEELRAVADCVYFREEVLTEVGPGEIPMHFDYTLRPGVSTTTNALALLELVGLSGGDSTAESKTPARAEPKEASFTGENGPG